MLRRTVLCATIFLLSHPIGAEERARLPGNVENPSAEVEQKMIVVGAGGAADVELGAGGRVHGGANVFVEYEPIDEWLELELGVSVLSAEKGRETTVDLLFKKPFTLTRQLEVMIGVGPELVHASGGDKNGTSFGVEFAVDFMFWPSRHFGVWLEPSYDIVFRNGSSRSFGSTGGLLFRW